MGISEAKKRANAKYNKEHITRRFLALTLEDDEKLGRFLEHIGQGYSELVRNLIIQEMDKYKWEDKINPPKIKGKRVGEEKGNE